MARLIDVDALEEGKFHGTEDLTPIECALWQWGWNDAIDAIIDNAPTVDAVEVVRCKDCFHFWDGVCKAHIDVIYVDDNDFCSMGERKDDSK